MRTLIRSRKTRVSVVLATAAVSMGLIAAPAAQAQPVITGGLVNVTVVDAVDINNNRVLNNVGIGVGANVAANVCGGSVNVAVLGIIRDPDGTVTCSTGDQTVTIERLGNRGNGGNG